MGKIFRLSRHYAFESYYITKAQLQLAKVVQFVKYFSVAGKKQVTPSGFHATTFVRSKQNTLSPEKIETLAITALQACAAQPAKFHDLSKLLILEDTSKSLSFDIGESMAQKGLAEFCFRASRICIKITPEGLNYLKVLESNNYKPQLA